LVAALNFHIFHEHGERVTMANIAQTVNVLQAMVLTDRERMLVTPTYHVFEMYKVHQDARLLSSALSSGDYRFGDEKLSQLSLSASINQEGRVQVSVANCDPQNAVALDCGFEGLTPKRASGRVLTAEAMNAHNTFDAPDLVRPVVLQGVQLEGTQVRVTLPAKSVAVLLVE